MSATHKMVEVTAGGTVSTPIQVRQGEYLALSTTGSTTGTLPLEYSPDYTPLRPDAGTWLQVVDDAGDDVDYTAGAANPEILEGPVGWVRLDATAASGNGIVWADRGYRR